MKSLTSFLQSVDVFRETFHYLKKSDLPDADIEKLKMEWARRLLDKVKVKLEVVGKPTDMNSVLFVGNHLSYLDIPLLVATTPKLSFVAKHEISNWPVFGKAAKKIETVFVKRENNDSRKATRKYLFEALEMGRRIAIFPSGTTCLAEKKAWRRGAFEIAQELDLYVQPFKISYDPLRTVAYIDDDVFFSHLINLFKCQEIKAKIEFHEPVKVKDPVWDALYWQYWSSPTSDLRELEISAPPFGCKTEVPPQDIVSK